jgi:hypothetical protein
MRYRGNVIRHFLQAKEREREYTVSIYIIKRGVPSPRPTLSPSHLSCPCVPSLVDWFGGWGHEGVNSTLSIHPLSSFSLVKASNSGLMESEEDTETDQVGESEIARIKMDGWWGRQIDKIGSFTSFHFLFASIKGLVTN